MIPEVVTAERRVMILNNGVEEDLDTVLTPAEKHKRTRERKGKVVSSRPNVVVRTGPQSLSGDKMSQTAFNLLLSSSWSFTRQQDHKKFGGPTKYQHGLTLTNGELYCSICSRSIKSKNLVAQHLAGKRHQKALLQPNKVVAELVKIQQTVTGLQKKQEEEGLSGKSVSYETKGYRLLVLDHACQANMSLGMLDRFKPFLDMVTEPGLTVGNTKDLVRTFAVPLLENQAKGLRLLLSTCYPEFGTISDATPVGAEAEACKIRQVTRSTFVIIEPLVTLKLFNQKLSGTNIANHLIKTIVDRCALDPTMWQVAIMDRASTNTKALKDIHRNTVYRPTDSPCHSHTLNKPGESFNAPEAESIRKAFNGAIMYRGKAYQVAYELLGCAPLISGGVRWWIKWEQECQLELCGLECFLSTFILKCQQKKYSDKSIVKLEAASSPYLLPKAIVQFATIAEQGRPFCQSTYSLEGDDPLALSAYIAFNRIDDHVSDGIILGERTIDACKRAAGLVREIRAPLLASILLKKESVKAIEIEIKDIETKNDTTLHESPTGNPPEQRRSSRPRHNLDFSLSRLGMAPTERRTEPTITLPTVIQQTARHRERLKSATDSLIADQSELLLLDQKLGPITYQDFKKHAKEVVQPGFDKYNTLYHKPIEVGNAMPVLMRSRKAFGACKLFDPLFLTTNPAVATLEVLADDLKYFEFEKIDLDFINALKKEIPLVMEYAARDFNWESIHGSHLYNRRVLDRARRAKQRVTILTPNDENERNITSADIEKSGKEQEEISPTDIRHFDNWKDDIGERARRIWEWWRCWFVTSHPFPHFATALRLVVLVQPSSAATERVFSQLQFIRRVCGDSILEDMLELRSLIRCNNQLTDNFDVDIHP